MANEHKDRMTPSDWKRATNELVALSQKAQEHIEPPKPNAPAKHPRGRTS